MTSQFTQSEISRQRFPDIEFIQANAIEYLSTVPNDSVDRIFALDCAYHFSSRRQFLKESAKVLRSGGKIVMTDLILGDKTTVIQRFLLRIICLLTDSPYSNYKIRKNYYREFIDTGLVEVSMEDFSSDVFPGLVTFIRRHRREMGRFEISGYWTGFLAFASLLDWWWRKGIVRFVIVHATKPKEM